MSTPAFRVNGLQVGAEPKAVITSDGTVRARAFEENGQRVLVLSDVERMANGNAISAILGGSVGGLLVLVFLVLVQTLRMNRAQRIWERSQPKPEETPYR